MRHFALKAFVVTVVSVGVIVLALALWKLKLILMLLFLAVIVAAAMRPSVEALARKRVPRGVAVLLHYAVLAGAVVALLWVAVPRAIDQVQQATGGEAQSAASAPAVSGPITGMISTTPAKTPTSSASG